MSHDFYENESKERLIHMLRTVEKSYGDLIKLILQDDLIENNPEWPQPEQLWDQVYRKTQTILLKVWTQDCVNRCIATGSHTGASHQVCENCQLGPGFPSGA